MYTVTCQKAVVILATALATVVGVSVAIAAEDKKSKPLSPETILEKKFEGQATVELLVGEVETYTVTESVFVPGDSHTQILKTKISGAKEGEEFWVIVSKSTATRLLRLGIADPAEHFRGKVVRVSGTVERGKPSQAPTKTVHRIHVNSLDQLESIREP